MKTSHLVAPTALSLGLMALLAEPTDLRAQTDNFDNYSSVAGLTTNGWLLSEMAAGLTQTTFPAVDTGKGMRVQANPLLGGAPAVAIWYRTTEYTNFYVAADFVKWSDTNQTFALLARGAIGDDPGGASGYLLNYDVAERGDGATTPRQGELQISVLSPSFNAMQLALGEVTLEPGRPYRFVFTGAGFHLKAQVYDLYDLTRPLIEMDVTNQTYTSGICGLMAYSRDDAVGTTDVTVDNYEIGQLDSNPATVPALIHPVTGTPTIESRNPAERFQNCFDRSSGLNFMARTFTTEVINGAATRLWLNGVDFSSQLALSPNAPSISISLSRDALSPNTVYSGQLEVADVTGLKKSTNTFYFDTFSDAFLTAAGVKVIEAEDYNYSNGVYQLDPIAVSGLDRDGLPLTANGVGYFNLAGIEGVDYHDVSAPESLWASEFRDADAVGLSEGMYPEIQDAKDPWGETRYTDRVRPQYATNSMLEYVVHRTEPGEWLNYTRNFAAGKYTAWLRVASLGSTEVLLGQVTSNPSLPSQTVVPLGKFSVPNMFARYHYRYVPLLDNSGSPVELTFSGTTTLRLTMAGTPGQDIDKLAINYMLFVPSMTLRVFSSPAPAGTYTEETGASIDTAKRTITVPASGATRFYRLSADMALTIRNLSVSEGMVTINY